MEWYIMALKRFSDFQGRSRRKEYWFFQLFNLMIIFAISFMETLSGVDIEEGLGPFAILFSLIMFIPGLAVSVRRLHDTNRSGFWLLMAFIPLIGFIVLLYFMFSEGDEGSNSYGPDPKQDQIIHREAKEPEDFWKREDF
ncbi:MAG: DUF805 domain-containing protein [Candidatus Cyclonatronum sp.]|uniref:DUF805 domain-containing protein n=1 Tax=Cyclonatronum sp. TaxID=3024185 RepID=UPI0025BCAA54|nr:DUF805 domain-containing protein [Cyclonatronum sp.]MCH8485358.1 DUF805 domain-containing protein [Cyclonatronum sp.]